MSHLYEEADHPWKDPQPVKWTQIQFICVSFNWWYTENISPYLFFFATLLKNKLIKDGSKLLVDLLHLIDVAGHFVHRFHGDCTQETQLMELM